MRRKFLVVSKRIVYKDSWLLLKEFAIKRDGKDGSYTVVERPNAVIIVASTPDNRILFENIYRFPTDENSWELPAGGMDPGESPEDAARRELLEEAGLDLALNMAGAFHPLPGLTPQNVFVFTGVLTQADISKLEQYDKAADEIRERRLLTPDQIDDMVANQKISNGLTLSALAIIARTAR